MLEFKKINNDMFYSVSCNHDAEYVISDNRLLKIVSSNGPHDGEISLCKNCAKKLLKWMNMEEFL